MIKKIYIAGKVTGLPYEETYKKFVDYAKTIVEQGNTPVVPLTLCNKDDEWFIAMRKCIGALVTCDEIHLLPDFMYSPGAWFEYEIAHRLKITIVYIPKKNHHELSTK